MPTGVENTKTKMKSSETKGTLLVALQCFHFRHFSQKVELHTGLTHGLGNGTVKSACDSDFLTYKNFLSTVLISHLVLPVPKFALFAKKLWISFLVCLNKRHWDIGLKTD